MAASIHMRFVSPISRARSLFCLPICPNHMSEPPKCNGTLQSGDVCCFGSLVEPAAPIERCSCEEKEMRLLTRLLAAAVLTTAGYLSVPAMNVVAQAPSPGPSESSLDLSDQKLSAAAAAIERVASLRQEYRQRVAEAEAPADKERIVAEANNELTKAVTEQGLSVEEYVSILDAARDNPEIRRPSGQ